MNKANIGWWEADLKAETYKCSELISQLLGIGEDGLISFEDFNKRIVSTHCMVLVYPISQLYLCTELKILFLWTLLIVF